MSSGNVERGDRFRVPGFGEPEGSGRRGKGRPRRTSNIELRTPNIQPGLLPFALCPSRPHSHENRATDSPRARRRVSPCRRGACPLPVVHGVEYLDDQFPGRFPDMALKDSHCAFRAEELGVAPRLGDSIRVENQLAARLDSGDGWLIPDPTNHAERHGMRIQEFCLLVRMADHHRRMPTLPSSVLNTSRKSPPISMPATSRQSRQHGLESEN
jgi:hypothetical protein